MIKQRGNKKTPLVQQKTSQTWSKKQSMTLRPFISTIKNKLRRSRFPKQVKNAFKKNWSTGQGSIVRTRNIKKIKLFIGCLGIIGASWTYKFNVVKRYQGKTQNFCNE